MFFFFFKQKTAYEMRISDWSSDVCSSDLQRACDDAGQLCRPAVDFSRDRYGIKPGIGAADLQSVSIVDFVIQFVERIVVGLAQAEFLARPQRRSEERRVGKGCVGKCRSRWVH